MAKQKKSQTETEDPICQEETQETAGGESQEVDQVALLREELEDLRAKLQEREALAAELDEYRKAKEEADKQAEEADKLKPCEVVVRHIALHPKHITRNGAEKEMLAKLVVEARNEEHAKALFIQKTAERIKSCGIGNADTNLKHFLSTAHGGDYTFTWLG